LHMPSLSFRFAFLCVEPNGINMRRLKQYYSRMSDMTDALSGFCSLALATALFTVPNIAVFFAVSLHPELIEILWLSIGTPWGIITAAFLHREAAHLLQNLHGFLAAVVLFALSNLLQSRENKERYSRIFLLLVFPSGFLANAVELLARLASNSVAGWSGYGASGVVYSAIGICTASAVINSCALFIGYIRSFRDPDSKDITIPELLVMAFNLALMIFAVYLVVFARDLFLNTSPGIDVFAHTAGFLIGFFSVLLFAEHDRRKR